MQLLCKNCGASLEFLENEQKMYCKHCDSIFEINEFTFDDSIYEEMNTYTCSSCGAELITFDKTGVSQCIYCSSKEFVVGKANKDYFLRGMIPFKINKEQFIDTYEDFLKNEPKVDPYVIEHLDKFKVTKTYLPYSFANNFFGRLYPKAINDSLEEVLPFDFKELKDLNPLYFDGCFAEIIKTKMEQNDIVTSDKGFYWVPIWVAEFSYDTDTFYIIMNGQTGEMAGNYPEIKKSPKIKEYNDLVFAVLFICIIASAAGYSFPISKLVNWILNSIIAILIIYIGTKEIFSIFLIAFGQKGIFFKHFTETKRVFIPFSIRKKF